MEAGRDHRVRRIGHADESRGTVTAGFYWLEPSVFDFMERRRRGAFRPSGSSSAFSPRPASGCTRLRVAKTIDVDRPEDVAAAEGYLRGHGAAGDAPVAT